jgi:hypothetical protein
MRVLLGLLSMLAVSLASPALAVVVKAVITGPSVATSPVHLSGALSTGATQYAWIVNGITQANGPEADLALAPGTWSVTLVAHRVPFSFAEASFTSFDVTIVSQLPAAPTVPLAEDPVEPQLPSYVPDLQAFTAAPPEWNKSLVNVLMGCYPSECRIHDSTHPTSVLLRDHWQLFDALDRSEKFGFHGWLERRGIPHDTGLANEYTDTLGLENEARDFFLADVNGLARSLDNEPRTYAGNPPGVMATNLNDPRWFSIIDYDLMSAPSLGSALSQDNIGGPQSFLARQYWRYSDHDLEKFVHFAPGYSLSGLRSQLAALELDQLIGNPDRELLLQDPLASRYQIWNHVGQLHDWMRIYRHAKRIAARANQDFSVHGNQLAVVWPGVDAYEYVLSDYVDTLWFESLGISQKDLLDKGKMSALGVLRTKLAAAFSGGRKPYLFIDRQPPNAPANADALAFEWAEVSAGGAGLLTQPSNFPTSEPGVVAKLLEFLTLRSDHRALYEMDGRTSEATVAIVYSVPTMVYTHYDIGATYNHTTVNDLNGAAFALTRNQIPFDVVVLEHPELTKSRIALERLSQYDVLILPNVVNLSPEHLQLIANFQAMGGLHRVLVLGNAGLRDHANVARPQAALRAVTEGTQTAWVPAALDPAKTFHFLNTPVGSAGAHHPSFADWFPNGAAYTQANLDRVAAFAATVRGLEGNSNKLKTFNAPPTISATPWKHINPVASGDNLYSIHFVNYDLTYSFAAPPQAAVADAHPTNPFTVRFLAPWGVTAQKAVWLAPGQSPVSLPITVVPGNLSGPPLEVVIPSFESYGVLVVGKDPGGGLSPDQVASWIRQGDQRRRQTERATHGTFLHTEAKNESHQLAVAKRNTTDASEYAATAATNRLTRAGQLDADYIASFRNGAAMAQGSALALDFRCHSETKLFAGSAPQGCNPAVAPWRRFTETTMWTPSSDYGWVDAGDGSPPLVENDLYRANDPFEIIGSHPDVAFWPYPATPPTTPYIGSLHSQAKHRFRIRTGTGGLAAGQRYRVKVVSERLSAFGTSISSFLRVNGVAKLLDTPLLPGSMVVREFTMDVSGDHTEIELGASNGWGVAAMVFTLAPNAPTDTVSERYGVRSWQVSPRYENEQWYPVDEARTEVDAVLGADPAPGWTTLRATPGGIPVISLGTLDSGYEAVGQVVYAATTVSAGSSDAIALHVGATSAVEVYVDGNKIDYLPNQKGIVENEAVITLPLDAGENHIVLKLERFWEREWLFYAALAPLP